METVITLDRFKPRPYQMPLINAFEKENFKRLLVIWPRRAGKDVVAFNLLIRAALRKIGVYYYIFPTYSQGKKVIWDSIKNDGQSFLSYIPDELVVSKNATEMKIVLSNSSIIQIVGSDNVDSLMGTNPQGCVFSEYALQSPLAYQYLRPILLANGGWSLFVSTPRGKNNLWELFKIADKSKDWFCNRLTLDDTKHILYSEILKEKEEGLMSEDLIQQEYFTSFDMGVEGAYYAKYIDELRNKERIGIVDWDPAHKVHTAWDLGVADSTVIIWFQCIGTNVHVIESYERSKEGLEFYIKLVNSKPYQYGKHIAPHDIANREWTSGIARIDKARQLGISFTIADKLSIMDGIEAVRSALPKMYFDENRCADLLKALENYRQEWDEKKKVYKNNPRHDQFSHYADAMRYLAISLPKLRDGLTKADLDRMRANAYGNNNQYQNFGLPTQDEYDRNRSNQW